MFSRIFLKPNIFISFLYNHTINKTSYMAEILYNRLGQHEH